MSKDIIKSVMNEAVSAVIKEDKYGILSPEQIKELAIDVVIKVLSERNTKL